jgi:hypothetical protein
MALAGVEGTIGGDAGDLLIGGIWSSSSGSMGASPTSLVVNSAARISSDFSSIPMWILRQTRRLEPPCLRAFHSPSPSTLIPVLSTKQVQRALRAAVGDVDLQGLLAADRVLKSGTAQSRPISRSRLSTNPVVCRSAMPNSTFIVRQVWIAASL